MEIPNDIQNQLKDIVLEAIIKEFIDKGHNLTGKGIKSLEAVISEQITGITITILGEPYMKFQNEGRGAGKMPNISALEDWVKRRGLASEMKEVKRIAWAIGMNMKRIGMHSDGASGKSGNRNASKLDLSKREFIDTAIIKEQQQISDLIFQGYNERFAVAITELFRNSERTILQA